MGNNQFYKSKSNIYFYLLKGIILFKETSVLNKIRILPLQDNCHTFQQYLDGDSLA